MQTIKALVKDTAVYGISSMLGRLLNWLLTYVYARVLVPESFGQMTNLYAWIALLLVVLTYGMETSFFRFANASKSPKVVYGTSLWALGISSALFIAIGFYFGVQISSYLGLGTGDLGLLYMLILISALDAFSAIPLAFLRFKQKPWLFMSVRMSFVLLTIILTLGVFYGIPLLEPYIPGVASWFNVEDSLHYILAINLVANVFQMLILLPTLKEASPRADWKLLGQMLHYSWPILLLGLVGVFSSQADKILFPMLFEDPSVGKEQLGIYSACYKLAVVMLLFTQAFRYAYDPFVFAQSREGGEVAKRAYASSMHYYVLFTLFIFLGVMSCIDILKLFITPSYYAGLPAVPLIMVGQLCLGIYSNLSLWYKLTDKTYWGAVLSVIGCFILVGIIVVFSKDYGFMACAWASVISNAVIMLGSYLLGQKYYPIPYAVKSLLAYCVLALMLYSSQELFKRFISSNEAIQLAYNMITLVVFTCVVLKKEELTQAIRGVLTRLYRQYLRAN